MADRKISALSTLSGATADIAADFIPINDVSEADATENKRIVLNELKNALGFDFSPPTTSTFTVTANAASATQSATDHAKKGLSFKATDAGAGATERIRFLGKTVPGATPWTATYRIRPGASILGEIVRMGAAIYDTVSGDSIILGVNNQSSVLKIFEYYFTALGTFGSSTFEKSFIPIGLSPIWFRISDDGTNNIMSFSLDDAVTWVTAATRTRASTLTATHVGIAINTFGVVTTLPNPTMLVDYYVES
jgi:hypothetical protein